MHEFVKQWLTISFKLEASCVKTLTGKFSQGIKLFLKSLSQTTANRNIQSKQEKKEIMKEVIERKICGNFSFC